MIWLIWLAGCAEPVAPVDPPAEPALEVAPAPRPGRAADQVEKTYAAELADLERRLSFFTSKAENLADAVAVSQAIALRVERGHLTGDYDDFAEAQRLVEVGLAASGSALVHHQAAYLDYTLHRYDSALSHLSDGRDDRALRAAIAFDRGDISAAEPVYVELAASEKPVHLSRLAILRWKTGDVAEAERLLDAAEAAYFGRSHRTRAWVHLQRGLIDLENGRLDDALAHYRDADRAMAGYWLIDEHVAEIHLLKGEHAEAERLYRDLIQRTGNPEFMDRLAEVLAATDRRDEAGEVVAKARAAYEARLARFPEATWGHALDHWLAWGGPEEALDMARKNFANRGNGEAALGLVEALARAGRLEEARAQLDALESSRFRTPEIDEVASRLASP